MYPSCTAHRTSWYCCVAARTARARPESYPSASSANDGAAANSNTATTANHKRRISGGKGFMSVYRLTCPAYRCELPRPQEGHVRAFAMVLVLALIAALAAGTSRAGGASASTLSVGDQLTYAVTVELQQHHVRGIGKNKDTVTESSAQGTITFTVYSIGRDGTAFTKADLNLSGNNAGQPVALQTATPAKVLPDGQLRTQAQVGLGVSDALAAANTTLAEIAQKLPLLVGKSWTTKAATPYVAFTMTRRVQDETAYQGHRAYALQSVGQGSLLKTTDGKPASGTISVGGTTYFDSRNRLLIGETFRTLTVVQQSNGTA